MTDTALELTAEERALIEARRAEPDAKPEPEAVPDAFADRCGAAENPKDPYSARCRLRLGEDAQGRPKPHGAEHHFVSEDNLDADPPFAQEAVTQSKVNTTGNPE
jgi:hypothetical protein